MTVPGGRGQRRTLPLRRSTPCPRRSPDAHAALRSCGSNCGAETEAARLLGVQSTRLLTRRAFLSGSMAHEHAWGSALWLAALPRCTPTACAAHPDDAASRVEEAYLAVSRWLPERTRPALDGGDPTYGFRYAGAIWDQRTKTQHVWLTKRLRTDPVRGAGSPIVYHRARHSMRELLTWQARILGRWRLLAARGVVAQPDGLDATDIRSNRLNVWVPAVTPLVSEVIAAMLPGVSVRVRAYPAITMVPPTDVDAALASRLSWYRWVSAPTEVDGIAPTGTQAAQRMSFVRGQLVAAGCNARQWRVVPTRAGTLVLTGGGYTTLAGCPSTSGDDRLDKILSSRPTIRLVARTLTLRSPAGDAAFVADSALPNGHVR